MNDLRMHIDLPFDPSSGDVVCRRVPVGGLDTAGQPLTRVSSNVAWSVIDHSPDGYEWSYGGSGPADFALNILNLFVPPGSDGHAPVRCFHGFASRTALALHQAFKWEFIATLPRAGGIISGAVIRAWIEQNRPAAAD